VSLADDVVANLRGFSKAMYSTWFHYKPARILLDAGEGVSSYMENFVFGVEAVFLSHGHYDHIGGIGGLVHSRASARGDKEKPLVVYYPRGDAMVELLREYVSRTSGNVRYDLEWLPVEAGQEIELGAGRERGLLRAFPVRHSARTVNLGYQLFERRTRLRPDLVGRPQDEITAIAQEQGADSVTEPYEQIVLAYCGDSAPVDPDQVRGAEVLMHEATFIEPGDRAHEVHSTVAEALEVARAADVTRLVLMHISTRYPKGQMARMIRSIAQEQGFDRPLTMVMGRRFTALLGEGGEPVQGERRERSGGTG